MAPAWRVMTAILPLRKRCRRVVPTSPPATSIGPDMATIEKGKANTMGLLLLLLIIFLLFGGGGYYGYRSGYYGGAHYGGGVGLIVLVLLLFLPFGAFSP